MKPIHFNKAMLDISEYVRELEACNKKLTDECVRNVQLLEDWRNQCMLLSDALRDRRQDVSMTSFSLAGSETLPAPTVHIRPCGSVVWDPAASLDEVKACFRSLALMYRDAVGTIQRLREEETTVMIPAGCAELPKAQEKDA